jgi:rifampicin phosphotransferase
MMHSERFPGLADGAPAERVGRKFAALAGVSRAFPVPAAVAVPVEEFRAALGEETVLRVKSLVDEVRATVGAFFTESAARIGATVAGVRLGDRARRSLRTRLREVFGALPDARFAVRSSGVTEDGPQASHAGVYRSLLDVRGFDAVVAAVEDCWRSYYAVPAIAARIRAGDYDPMPRLAVIIQRFVDPVVAGVAFSGLDGDPDDVQVEYVEGTADRLVAEGRPHRAMETPGPHGAVLAEVRRLTRELRRHHGHDVDVEWAADGAGVRVLQVRPVTARRTGDGPEFWVRRLYFEEPPAGASLGAVAATYAAFSAKRGPANRLAADRGVAVTNGWLVGFTGRALDDPATAHRFAAALANGRSEECLVDFGDTLRQIVVPGPEVVDLVRAVGCAGHPADERQAVVVRDYLRGQLGVVSRRSAGTLVVEYTAAGLLALNRGTAPAERLVVHRDGPAHIPPGGLALRPHLPLIADFTDVMQERYGEVNLEWVLFDDRLVFLDHSVIGDGHELTTHSGTVISAGSASGPVLSVADDDFLSRLSIGPAVSIGEVRAVPEYAELAALVDRVRRCAEPPIVRARLPYAVLSVLIGSVAGFVFDDGSVLSHLSILLREAGVPAVCASGITGVVDGRRGAISGGVFSVA